MVDLKTWKIINKLSNGGFEITLNGDEIECSDKWASPPREYLMEKVMEFKKEIIMALKKKPPPTFVLPHISKNGDLIIPFNSPKKFKWWQGGMSSFETRKYLTKLSKKEEGKK